MTRWSKTVAVLAAWLGLGMVAQAQPGYPMPVGAARMPDPLAYTPAPQPMLVPGAMSPLMAPPGPPDSLNLPASHTSAFQLENFPPETAWYAALGAVGLRRHRQGQTPLVLYDDQSNGRDTGLEPIGNLPIGMKLREVAPLLHFGPKATVGFLFGNQSLEFTGFYISDKTNTRERRNQGRLHVPFYPANTFPLGFEGNNNLWLQADLFQARYTDAIGNAELNYRVWNGGINTVEMLIGLRYFYEQERVELYTDDEYYVRDAYERPEPRRQATYSVTTRNNLAMIQFGGEYSVPIPMEKLGWIWITWMGKSAMGPNFIERTLQMTRGDGRVGFLSETTSLRLAGMYDIAGYVDFHILERLRLRAGYTAMAAIGVSAAGKQIEWNLNRQGQRTTDYSTMFWHGPSLEFQFLF